MKLSEQEIERALSENVWTFGNNVLYDLCQKHPRHDSKPIVVAKILLIGRSYAAAIERRRPSAAQGLLDSDKFYEDIVAPALMQSPLDRQIESLHKYTSISSDSLPAILRVHKDLTDIFKELTGLEKRSLASKYLHFHKPSLFYLYDSRASKGLRSIMPRHRPKTKISGKYDSEYQGFALKLFDLQQEIEDAFGKPLTPRQLDNLLLARVG